MERARRYGGADRPQIIEREEDVKCNDVVVGLLVGFIFQICGLCCLFTNIPRGCKMGIVLGLMIRICVAFYVASSTTGSSGG